MNESKGISTAVVGYGFAGRCFHSYLVSLAAPALALKGVVSSRVEARADITGRLGVHAWERFEEVLGDDDVELVVLATPNDLHASQAIAALEAGKHVVTDKPMCLDGSLHCFVVMSELGTDRSHLPMLGVEQPADLGALLAGNH